MFAYQFDEIEVLRNDGKINIKLIELLQKHSIFLSLLRVL